LGHFRPKSSFLSRGPRAFSPLSWPARKSLFCVPPSLPSPTGGTSGPTRQLLLLPLAGRPQPPLPSTSPQNPAPSRTRAHIQPRGHNPLHVLHLFPHSPRKKQRRFDLPTSSTSPPHFAGRFRRSPALSSPLELQNQSPWPPLPFSPFSRVPHALYRALHADPHRRRSPAISSRAPPLLPPSPRLTTCAISFAIPRRTPASTRFPSTAIGTTSPPCNLSPPLAAELRPPLLATLATAKPRHRHSRLRRSKPSTGHRLVPLIHHRAALPTTNQSHRRHFRLRPRRTASSVRPVLCRRPPRYRSHHPWLSNPSVFAGRRRTHLPVPPGPSDHRPPVPAHGTPPNRHRRCLPEERRRLFPPPATSRSASSARTLACSSRRFGRSRSQG
jgi:hypothetical protein